MLVRKYNRLKVTWARKRSLHFFRWFCRCGLLIACLFIYFGAFSLHRDRPSLDWPTVQGEIIEMRVLHHPGRRSRFSYDYLQASYVYNINGAHYISRQIALRDSNLPRNENAQTFAKNHALHSAVTVHYPPQSPGNAVLVPGADELAGHLFIYGGLFIIAVAGIGLFHTRREHADLAAVHEPTKPVLQPTSAESFLTYEAAARVKLNAFPDRESLLEVLKHKNLPDWQPEDRAIASSGHCFRFRKNPADHHYHLEPVEETWSWQKLLELAAQDAITLKTDPAQTRREVEAAPDSEKMIILMRHIDNLPNGPVWIWVASCLFLVLFFAVVVYISNLIFRLLGL